MNTWTVFESTSKSQPENMKAAWSKYSFTVMQLNPAVLKFAVCGLAILSFNRTSNNYWVWDRASNHFGCSSAPCIQSSVSIFFMRVLHAFYNFQCSPSSGSIAWTGMCTVFLSPLWELCLGSVSDTTRELQLKYFHNYGKGCRFFFLIGCSSAY